MKQKTLLNLFIAGLAAAAVASACLHVVSLVEDDQAGTFRTVTTFGFILVVEALRAIFVVSNTAVRSISRSWGIFMIFGSLLITAGLGMYSAASTQIWSDTFWVMQVYNVLILLAEWSVGTVVGGYQFGWDALTEDLKNLDSLKYNISSQWGGTMGQVNWAKIPDALAGLKTVVEAIHLHIQGMMDQHQTDLAAKDLVIAQMKQDHQLDLDQARSSGHDLDLWMPTGEANGGYFVFCTNQPGAQACKPFRVGRSSSTATCPSCGKTHDRKKVQAAIQMALTDTSEPHPG